MKICIVGSGHIGGGLARAWRAHGHEVVFGARPPADPELAKLCAEIGATAEPTARAAPAAEVIVLAMPYGALDAVLGDIGAAKGKLVVDCTNAVERGMQLKYGHTTSSAEELQKRIPEAHVFKSFNAQGAENLASPEYPGGRASNFFCGDDASARERMRTLVGDAGFDPVDAGPLANAPLLESLMLLWMASSRAAGSRDIAFKLLRR